MSDLTKQIRDNFESLIQTTLGSEWKVLENKYNLENNNFVNQTKRYGVTIGSGADPGEGVLKHYTIDRNFQLTLLQKHIEKINNDSSVEDAIDALEDALDDIAKAAFNNKLGVPSIVLNVTFDSVEAPDITTIENVTIIVATFIVKYRSALN